MKLVIWLGLGWIAGIGGILPVSAADTIANSKAAEFSLHRIERLVILHKLDATYQTHLERLDVTLLNPQQPSDPTFVIRASQVAGADGGRMSVDLAFDQIGRPMSQTVHGGPPSQDPPRWPDKDATTIAENALHWLEEQGPLDDSLRPFYQGLASLVLRPVRDAQGLLTAAEVTITIALDQPTLMISMGLDGVFQGYEIFPPILRPRYSSIRRLIFEQKCLKCHGPDGEQKRIPLAPLADLLDSPRELVLPGDSLDSGLFIAISRTDEKRMPPPKEGPPLTSVEIEAIVRWIDEGAQP